MKHPAKLRSILTRRPPHSGCDLAVFLFTRYVVRTVWFSPVTGDQMEHETAPFKTRGEAESWLAAG